jgi:hypothetical protein
VQPPQLRSDVRTGAPLPASIGDRLREIGERGDEHSAVDVPAAALALDGPLGRRQMTALTVASAAGSDLVLDPARPAFDAGNDVLGSDTDEPDANGAPAPHALSAVTGQDPIHALTTAQLARRIVPIHLAILPRYRFATRQNVA